MKISSQWLTIVRLGLVQASIGAMVVFATSTLNRVMVVELALPAIVPGGLVAFHYAVQMLRPRWGFGSDQQGRRKPWIIGGMAMLALGTVLAATATGLMRTNPGAGFALGLLAFALIGVGVGAAGTSLLVLLAKEVGERRRAAAATVVWMMMIAGFIVTAGVAGRLLDPFSIEHMIEASLVIAGTAFVVSLLAILTLEDAPAQGASGIEPRASSTAFWPALCEVWAEPEARHFTLFVFVSMLAYSAQELIIEPFVGTVFLLSAAESAKLAGLQHSGLLAGMIVVAVLGSAINSDRLRSMRFWTAGGCLASAVAILALAATGFGESAVAMRAALFALGFANGAFSISAIGAMMQLAGKGRSGREGVRMGLWGAAQALAFALGGLVGTSASDVARHLVGSASIAYAFVFIGEAFLFCCAAALAAHALPRTSRLRPRFGHPGVAILANGDIGDPSMTLAETFDAVIVGGGPAGATAACDLASMGRSVLLLDRAGRIKPCGGAIPPRLIRDFAIPDHLIVARATAARIVSPKDKRVHMPIDAGFVGMVDRAEFDEWLRERAVQAGAERRKGTFLRIERDPDGMAVVCHHPAGASKSEPQRIRARSVIGADGALSAIARDCVPGAGRPAFVFAYHEIVESPAASTPGFDGSCCDIYYRGALSPDFYSWIFPHGATTSIGTGSAHKGFSLRGAVGDLRAITGMRDLKTLRREGAPIPLKPLRRWDNGRDIVLAGDAAGVVAPASGEGIYYAMVGGRLAAEAVDAFCTTGDARELRSARKRFLAAHGQVFRALGFMQWFWYASDRRRELFVSLCRNRDVQKMTWDSYMNKELVRKDPMAYLRIFLNNMRHLVGLAPA